MKYYILIRSNPQIGVYHRALGRLKWADAKRKTITSYGFNYLEKFSTKREYEARCKELDLNIKTI